MLSVKLNEDNFTVDFSKELMNIDPYSTEFDSFMWSLKKTIFSNLDVNQIIIKIDGQELTTIGEYNYEGGIKREIDESANISVRLVPDVPNPVIVIDPGHGGIYNHAVAIDGALEKNIALDVALNLKNYLEAKGATVILTRSTDTQLSNDLNTDLKMRADIANNNNANMFISIHCNGGVASSNGVEAFWDSDHDVSTSKRLANEITYKISSRHGISQRYNRENNLAVLRNSNMTAVLVELGFITNASDYSSLDSLADRDAMAYSMYLGIRNFWWGY